MLGPVVPRCDLAARTATTEEALARFRDRPFDWTRQATCIHAFRAQAVAFGHSVPPVPHFRSPLGARRALRRAGFDDLRSLIGSILGPEIAPASMVVGDVALLAGDDFDAIAICAGGGQLLGWHGANLSRMQAFSVDEYLGAWRI